MLVMGKCLLPLDAVWLCLWSRPQLGGGASLHLLSQNHGIRIQIEVLKIKSGLEALRNEQKKSAGTFATTLSIVSTGI